MGVGLAVVARYVKNMKGQIRVQSELGKGTIFGIELPFQHATEEPGQSVPMGPLFEAKEQAMLRALSDTSSTPFTPSARHEMKDIAEATPVVLPDEIISPSPQEEPSNLTSPSSQSGGMSSHGTSSRSMYPFPNMDGEKAEYLRKPLSVLIAEDNPINARLLVRRLTKLGHTVEHVNDGQECHDQFALTPQSIDVILMDIQVSLFS
jgi:CheY-like chemotaxis protein